ncbi:thioredoxin [Tepidamorphus sp. 3E244]|uniref:thioredoxin n=1 Tax=Tepidamorphus sp. 3E244 TaxID=3385498 RepID=UPI0038FC4243
MRALAVNILAALALVAVALSSTLAATGKTELVMFEQDRCEWCAEWHRVIGPIYPKSPEGKLAPLRRVDIHKPLPDDLAGINPGRFTPTFVLMHEGREIGRIRGYPGEDFFWGLLGRLMVKLKPTTSETPENT